MAEDVGPGDLTTESCLPGCATARGRVVARSAGTIAGLWLLELVYEALGVPMVIACHAAEGQQVEAGTSLAEIRGSASGLLTGERTALNFVQRLSGIATLTRRYVDAAAGTRVLICDTRKTTPGWRRLEKYAVRQGGGTNHRVGLWDEVLIKDNHIALAGIDLAELVARVRDHVAPETVIEVEVDTFEQLRAVIDLPVDRVLLDNMTPAQLAEAVAMRDATSRRRGKLLLEASGGITLETVAEVAASGVDRISVGALTHSAASLDIALDIEPGPAAESGS